MITTLRPEARAGWPVSDSRSPLCKWVTERPVLSAGGPLCSARTREVNC